MARGALEAAGLSMDRAQAPPCSLESSDRGRRQSSAQQISHCRLFLHPQSENKCRYFLWECPGKLFGRGASRFVCACVCVWGRGAEDTLQRENLERPL